MEYIYPLIHKSLLKTHCMKSKRLSHPLLCTDWEIKKKKDHKAEKDDIPPDVYCCAFAAWSLKLVLWCVFMKALRERMDHLAGRWSFLHAPMSSNLCLSHFTQRHLFSHSFISPFLPSFALSVCYFPSFTTFLLTVTPSTPWLFLFLVL